MIQSQHTRVILPDVLERARGASCNVRLKFVNASTGVVIDRSTYTHSVSLYTQAAIDGDTGVATAGPATGTGTALGIHDATLTTTQMASVAAGTYWLEMECVVGATKEKYLVKCIVTGRGKIT